MKEDAKTEKKPLTAVDLQRGVSKPVGKLTPTMITNFKENKAAIYFDAMFEDEAGNRWKAEFNSTFKFDLKAC